MFSLDPDPSVGDDGRLRYAQTFVLGEVGMPALADLGAIDNRAILLTPEATPIPTPALDVGSDDSGSGALVPWLMVLAALGLSGLVSRRRG